MPAFFNEITFTLCYSFKMNANLVILIVMFNIFLVVDTKKYRCKEQNVKNTLRLICKNVDNLYTIRNFLVRHLKSKVVDEMRVQCRGKKNLQVLHLSDNIFFDFKIYHINMRCPLLSIDDNAFAKTHLLFKLHLSNTEFHKIPSAIRNTKTLQTLEIEDGKLTEITSELQSMSELVNLSLSHNRISSLLSSAFLGDQKLQSIILTSNRLSSLDNRTFDLCPNLRLVKLDQNNLLTVDGLFRNPNLMNIDLSFNTLSTIPEDLFNNLENLMTVNLEGNFLRSIGNCFAQSHSLEYINLSNNMIKSCNNTFHSLRSLKTIDLRDNSLPSITRNYFSSLPLLEELIISQNNISHIDTEAFSQLEQLRKIDLSRNRLTTLSRESFPRALKIQEIITTGNKWACDCRLLWIKEWSEHAELKDLNTEFNCSSPLSFKSKWLNRLTKQDLSWPEEDCPARFCECSCVPYKDEGYAYVDCSSKGLSQIPSRFPELTIELNLQENLLSNPIELNLPPMSKLRTLNLERNFISRLDFSLPNNIVTLRLAENNITRFYNNPPSYVQTFTLSHNPWQCDCDTLPFRKWMLAESSKISDVNETRCSFEEERENMRGRVIITLTEIELCPKLIRNYILMGVGGAAILMITVASILLYFRYRYHLKVWLYSRGWRCFKKRDKRDDGKLFDAYISFTDEDAARVRKHFLPELEEKHPFYKLFVPQRDLKAGNFEINYLMERVVDSKRTVILLTKHYLRNEFCMEIFRVALANSLEEKLHRIILVKFGPLPTMKEMDQSLRIVMESSRCLKFREKLFWEMLRYEMPEKCPNIDDYELLDDQPDDVPLIQEL